MKKIIVQVFGDIKDNIEKAKEDIKNNVGLAIAAVIIIIVVVAGGGYAGYRIYEDKISEDTLLVDRTETTNELTKNETDTANTEKSDTSEKQDKDAVKNDDKADKEDTEATTEDKKTDKVAKNDKLVKEDKNAKTDKTDSKKTDSAKKETTTTSSNSSNDSSSSASSNSSNSNSSSSSNNNSSSNKSNNSSSSSSNNNSSSSSSSSSGNSSGGTTSKAETTCSHNWVWKTKTVHHDAVTHKEEYWSDPIEQPIQETRIQCGKCDNYYMDMSDYRANDTCMSSWSEVTVTTGWYTEPGHLIDTVTVVDQEAYDEEVNDYQYCSKCGARK